MNIEIESQILCQEEIEKFRRLYEIVDEDDIEEVKLERALFLFCGRRLPSIDACRREKSRVDTVERGEEYVYPVTRSILFGDGRSVRVEDVGGKYKLKALKDEAGLLKKSDFKDLASKFGTKESETHVYIQSPVAMKPARQDTKQHSSRAERRMTFDHDTNIGLVPLVKEQVDMLATLLHKETLEPLLDDQGNPIQFFVPGKILTKCYAHALGSDVKPSALNRFSKHGELFKVQTPCEVLYFENGVAMTFEEEPVDNFAQSVKHDKIGAENIVEVVIEEPTYIVYDHSTHKIKPIPKRTFDQAYHFMERDRFMATPKGLYRRQSMLGGQLPSVARLQSLNVHRTPSFTRPDRLSPSVAAEFERLKDLLNHGENSFVLRFLIMALHYSRKQSTGSSRVLDLTTYVKVFETLKSETTRLFKPASKRFHDSNRKIDYGNTSGGVITSFLLYVLFFPLAGFPSSFRDSVFGFSRIPVIKRPPTVVWPSYGDFMLYGSGLIWYLSLLMNAINVLGDMSRFNFLDVSCTWLMVLVFLVLYPCLIMNHETIWKKMYIQLSLTKYVVTVPAILKATPDPDSQKNKSSNCFLTAYDILTNIKRKTRMKYAGQIQLQIFRIVTLSFLVSLLYVILYLDTIASKREKTENAIFGAFNVLSTFLSSIAVFSLFEYATREVIEHEESVRLLDDAKTDKGIAQGNTKGEIDIDFLWPENVVAWRHIQKALTDDKNGFVDIACSIGLIVGLAQITLFIVSIIIAGDATEIKAEYVYLAQGFVCVCYSVVITREAVNANQHLKNVSMTLQMEEANIVTESPVLNPTNLPFDPRPPDLSTVHLPKFVEDLIHRLAENAHDVWSKRKLQDGWIWGEKNDVQHKRHTDLIPYKYLSCVTQSYDYLMVQETSKALYSMGYRIKRPLMMGSIKNKKMVMPVDKNGKPIRLPHEYVPSPVETRVEDMPVDLVELNEALATHVHHKWARSRMDQGYLYGDKRCDDHDAPSGLRHPFLKRFENLDDETKEANRNASAEILKTMIALGFKIVNIYATKSSLLLPLDQRRIASLRNMQSLQPIVELKYYQLMGYKLTQPRWFVVLMFSVAVVLSSIILLATADNM